MKLHPYTWRCLGAATLLVLAMASLALLAGCGGGEPDDPPSTMPVECKANPKACV